MNNLVEWEAARKIVKKAWENWKPHFEILTSDSGEKILAFFLLDDTSIEWKLYHEAPEGVMKDFADYMEDAKDEFLKQVGFSAQNEDEMITEKMATNMSKELSELMKQYERKTGLELSKLTFNMLFYSEWLALPEMVLEERYKEQMKIE